MIVYIWIPGLESAFFPDVYEQMGPPGSYEEMAGVSRPTIMEGTLQECLQDPKAQNLTWGPSFNPDSPTKTAQ